LALFGFVFSSPAGQHIAICSFQIRVYADLTAGKLALFFQNAPFQFVSRPTRGNRHPAKPPELSDLDIRI